MQMAAKAWRLRLRARSCQSRTLWTQRNSTCRLRMGLRLLLQSRSPLQPPERLQLRLLSGGPIHRSVQVVSRSKNAHHSCSLLVT